MTQPLNEDWGGDEIDLRAAEEHDIEEAELISNGTATGTVTLDALTFTADVPLEILALRYKATVALEMVTGTVVNQATLRRRGKAFAVTVRDTFGEGRTGDYLKEEVLASPADTIDNTTDGVGAGFDGNDGLYLTLMDPGLDSPTAPLVLAEGEDISVHLEQVGENAPAAGAGDQVLRHRLDVWWEEVPEAETEVRRRGDFPSGREITG